LISRPLRFNLAQGGEQTGHGRTSPFARTMPEPFCGTASSSSTSASSLGQG